MMTLAFCMAANPGLLGLYVACCQSKARLSSVNHNRSGFSVPRELNVGKQMSRITQE